MVNNHGKWKVWFRRVKLYNDSVLSPPFQGQAGQLLPLVWHRSRSVTSRKRPWNCCLKQAHKHTAQTYQNTSYYFYKDRVSILWSMASFALQRRISFGQKIMSMPIKFLSGFNRKYVSPFSQYVGFWVHDLSSPLEKMYWYGGEGQHFSLFAPITH